MAKNLWELKKLSSGKILSLCETAAPNECVRLHELGLITGQEITCLKASPFKGPRIYKVSDSIFSLAQEVANKIMIEEI